jgi:5-(carboxyamino)imidazole ribonucleotide synthase
MANLLGDVWENGEPNWAAALSDPNIKLHLYGKEDPRPGRKMGHLTSMAATVEDAISIAARARRSLTIS